MTALGSFVLPTPSLSIYRPLTIYRSLSVYFEPCHSIQFRILTDEPVKGVDEANGLENYSPISLKCEFATLSWVRRTAITVSVFVESSLPLPSWLVNRSVWLVSNLIASHICANN